MKFQVDMKKNDMFAFMMYHTYTGFSGIFGVCISLVAAITLAVQFHDLAEHAVMILGFIALLFTIINPCMLYTRSVRQVKLNPTYKKPLQYLINQEGVTVSQGEDAGLMQWEQCIKVIETKKQIFIYSSKIHAFILPKKNYESQVEGLRSLIKESVKDNRVKIKGKLRK